MLTRFFLRGDIDSIGDRINGNMESVAHSPGVRVPERPVIRTDLDSPYFYYETGPARCYRLPAILSGTEVAEVQIVLQMPAMMLGRTTRHGSVGVRLETGRYEIIGATAQVEYRRVKHHPSADAQQDVIIDVRAQDLGKANMLLDAVQGQTIQPVKIVPPTSLGLRLKRLLGWIDIREEESWV